MWVKSRALPQARLFEPYGPMNPQTATVLRVSKSQVSNHSLGTSNWSIVSREYSTSLSESLDKAQASWSTRGAVTSMGCGVGAMIGHAWTLVPSADLHLKGILPRS